MRVRENRKRERGEISTCHMSHVRCQMSDVTCQMSHVICRLDLMKEETAKLVTYDLHIDLNVHETQAHRSDIAQCTLDILS